MSLDWKPISASTAAQRTVNPIRSIVDNLKVQPHPNKQMISLALGDPTIFGNFTTADLFTQEIVKQVTSHQANGYPPSTGYLASREAIAKACTTSEAPLAANDVIIASGCSGAIELCISALANPGQNILLPQPGFSLYQTVAESKGIECRYYRLLPEKAWELDLAHVETLIDEHTALIVVNNPSNPCGSVYSKQHLQDILAMAERRRLPILADEIYADMAFEPFQFFPLATLTKTVPILSVGGIAKRFLVPGWRVGWVLIHDRNQILSEVRKGLVALSQLILGANSLVQAALPAVLANTPASFFEETLKQLQSNAQLSADMLGKVPGLQVVIPQGAMYMMVGVDVGRFKDIKSDIDFVEKLVAEESVLCLPGQCFKQPNFFRIVFTAPADKLKEAYVRIQSFCERHQ